MSPESLLRYIQQKALEDNVPPDSVNEYILKNEKFADLLTDSVRQLIEKQEAEKRQRYQNTQQNAGNMPVQPIPEQPLNKVETPVTPAVSDTAVVVEQPKPEIKGSVSMPESVKAKMEQIKKEVGAVSAEVTPEVQQEKETPEPEQEPKQPEVAQPDNKDKAVPTKDADNVEVFGYQPSTKLPKDEVQLEELKKTQRDVNDAFTWQVYWWARLRDNLKSAWSSIQNAFTNQDSGTGNNSK